MKEFRREDINIFFHQEYLHIFFVTSLILVNKFDEIKCLKEINIRETNLRVGSFSRAISHVDLFPRIEKF